MILNIILWLHIGSLVIILISRYICSFYGRHNKKSVIVDCSNDIAEKLWSIKKSPPP